ncbi:MAG: permease prefix domain 1-containing protein [Candidatus Izemoplasmatales bacterium]|nr:permease prefix domain 1-containing protein [Candidatus Izemoplasmatales bacterium]MDD5292791.1 permease prefix domain 1-containing protein [Candidatus Izemoplasmatales bacterium]
MNKIKKFVSGLLRGILNEDDKRELIEILTVSLEEKVDDLVEQGTPVDEAIEKSITEFGSADDVMDAFPDRIAKKNQAIRRRLNQLIFSLIAYLLICGIAIFLNLSFIDFFRHFYWFIVIVIGVLFWPLAMLYGYLKEKR